MRSRLRPTSKGSSDRLAACLAAAWVFPPDSTTILHRDLVIALVAALAWAALGSAPNKDALNSYLQEFPEGAHSEQVMARLKSLAEQESRQPPKAQKLWKKVWPPLRHTLVTGGYTLVTGGAVVLAMIGSAIVFGILAFR